MNFKLNIWAIATLVLLLLFLWQWNCRKPEPPKEVVKIEYKYLKDTSKGKPVLVSEQPGKAYKIVIQKVPYPVPGKTEYRLDTIYQDLDAEDSSEVVKDYFAIRDYLDTAQTKFGKVYIGSQVSENKLNQQNVVVDFAIPEKTTTITEQKAILFLGFDVYGDKKEILSGAGANLGLKTKKNKIYEVGVLKLQQIQELQYKAGFKIPLNK